MMKRIPLIALLIASLALVLAVGPANAKSGVLDSSFGNNGIKSGPVEAKAITGLTGDNSGRLLMSFTNFTDSFALQSSRFLQVGTFDLGFGDEGYASSQLGRPSASAMDVATGPQGDSFLVGWQGRGSRGNLGYMAAKFDASGEAVAGFGQNGTVKGAMASNVALLGAAVQRDGKLVAVGAADLNNGGKPAGIVMRFNQDGQLDRSFGGGIVRALKGASSKGSTGLLDIEILPDGKIVAGGYKNDQIAVVKLRPNGKHDSSFGGGDGIATKEIKIPVYCQLAGFCLRSSLAVNGNGDVFALGNYMRKGKVVPRVVKFTKSGKLAKGFAAHGVLASESLGIQDASEVLTRPNGKVVVVGSVGKGVGAAQYLKSGKPDRGFGSKGRAFTAAADYAESAVLQNNGALTLAGHKGLYGTKLIRFK